MTRYEIQNADGVKTVAGIAKGHPITLRKVRQSGGSYHKVGSTLAGDLVDGQIRTGLPVRVSMLGYVANWTSSVVDIQLVAGKIELHTASGAVYELLPGGADR